MISIGYVCDSIEQRDRLREVIIKFFEVEEMKLKEK